MGAFTGIEHDRWLRWRPAAFALLAAFVVMTVAAWPAAGATALPRCGALIRYEASDPLRTSGERALDAHGRRYVPNGISVYGGLEQWGGLTWAVEERVRAQIAAATGVWHANTVRLQVAQALYFKRPAAFLRELDREVMQITCADAMAVINDNTEFTTREPNPSAATIGFLEVLARRYRRMDNVIFDPFNEPRIGFRGPGGSLGLRSVWRIWQAGGIVDHVRYIGMQALVDAIRRQHANNLVWVEGPQYARTLSLIGNYPITGPNIELAFHHPDLNAPSTWRPLLHATRSYPEVEGEESQYSSPTRPECNGSAYAELPKLLQMLASYHDGLVAWTLQPGVLVASPRPGPITDVIGWGDPTSATELATPTTIGPNYGCGPVNPPQGMGQLAMAFFEHHGAANNPYGA